MFSKSYVHIYIYIYIYIYIFVVHTHSQHPIWYIGQKATQYFKYGRSSQSWELYRQSRNNVTKLKAVSMNIFFHERCHSDSFRNNSRQYLRNIKPYMTDKCKTSDQDMSKIFNRHFLKAASNIGNEEPIRWWNYWWYTMYIQWFLSYPTYYL